MTTGEFTRSEILTFLLRTTALGVIAYFTVKWAIDALDPTRKQKKKLTDLVIYLNFFIIFLLKIYTKSNLIPFFFFV